MRNYLNVSLFIFILRNVQLLTGKYSFAMVRIMLQFVCSTILINSKAKVKIFYRATNASKKHFLRNKCAGFPLIHAVCLYSFQFRVVLWADLLDDTHHCVRCA
jgi:hypothetical protein